MNTAGENLLVRADGSAQTGAGHVMRCLALGKAWQEQGGQVTFVCAEILPGLERRLLEEHVQVVTLEAEPGSEEDLQRTVEVAIHSAANWVVVDGYRFPAAYFCGLQRQGLRCLAIDDYARIEDYCADVVLNPGASARESAYAHRKPDTKLLLGSRFVLLRPEFAKFQKRRRGQEAGNKLLVTMGGSDPGSVTLKVLSALSQIAGQGIEIRVVAGSGYPDRKTLRAQIATMPGIVQLEESPKDMAGVMSWADVAISAAGGTCWELAYLGIPAVVIAISEDQRGVAQAAMEQGIALSLGWHEEVSQLEIEQAVQGLFSDPARRAAMSQAGQKLVDGQGPQRVVEILQSLV